METGLYYQQWKIDVKYFAPFTSLPSPSPFKLISFSDNFYSSSTIYQGKTPIYNGIQTVELGRYDDN